MSGVTFLYLYSVLRLQHPIRESEIVRWAVGPTEIYLNPSSNICVSPFFVVHENVLVAF